jgi:hypothetical protein
MMRIRGAPLGALLALATAGPVAAQPSGVEGPLTGLAPLVGVWRAQGAGFSTTLRYRWIFDGRLLEASNEVRNRDGRVIARYHGSYFWDAGQAAIVFVTASAGGEVHRGRAWWRDGVLWHEAEVSGGSIAAYASAVRPVAGRLEYFAAYGSRKADPGLIEGEALVYTAAEDGASTPGRTARPPALLPDD